MAVNERSRFVAEVANLARKSRGAECAQIVTKNGYTVCLTGMFGGNVGAISIVTPGGREVRRADGWKVDKTAGVAEFLWDVMEKDEAKAVERERLAGLKSVSITSTDATGSASGRDTSKYYLTPEQLADLLELAERMAATNVSEPR